MFRFKVSKFKNAAPKFPKREQCFTDVPIGTLMNSCGNHIAASCKFIAFNCELGGGHGIGVIGLEDYGRQQRSMPIIHGHSDFVSDMHFSPFDDSMLATGSFDGELKIWKIPEEGLTETLSHSYLSMPACKGRIENVLFHPAADNVLAATSQNVVNIFDVAASSLKYEIEVDSDELPFQSFCWKPSGDLMITSCKDTNLRIIDPRVSTVVAQTTGHEGIKDSKTVWLGDTDSILSAGFGKGRERSLGIWDMRNFQSPVTCEAVDNAGGTLMPFYDADTNMLLLAGKGDSKIYFYEVTDNATKLSLASSDSLDSQSSGMTMIPKRSVNVMQAEVSRLLQVTKNTIIPLSYIVPRRSYTEFYPELFPDTLSGKPSMTADQWFDGANEPVEKISLDPKKSKSKPSGHAEKPKTTTQQPASPALKPKHEEVKKPAVEHKTLVSEVKKVEEPKNSPTSSPSLGHRSPASKPKSKFHAFRVPKFKHLTGKPFHKSHNIENIKNFDQSLAGESDGLQAFNDLVAYPIAGPGGQIAVVKLSSPGRLPDAGLPVLQNPSALLDFAMNPFDNHIIAAACEDAHIRIWKVPENGLEETLEEPLLTLTGHYSKVNMVRFNPCVEGVLASASYDQTVKIWDLNTGIELFTLEEHPDHLLAMSWHPDGHLLATVGRDCMIRVFNPRKGTSPVAVGKGPDGPRGARIIWGGPDNEWLIVSGFQKDSRRCINIYDSKNLNDCLGSVDLEASPATLMLFYDEDSATVFATGKGDRTLLAYEISSDSPHIFSLNSFSGHHQHQGIAFLRKDLCDVREIEFTRAVRVSKSSMEQIAFHIPRVKKQFFQDDLFPDTRARWEPSMTCEQWINGANIPQRRMSLMPSDMKPLHTAAAKVATGKYDSYQRTEAPKSVSQQKEELMSSMMDKLVDVDGLTLEQDNMEGVEEHEWDD